MDAAIFGMVFLGIAFSLQLGSWFVISLILLWLMAFVSATHDISVDGFYMLALNENRQAFFSGIRSTFYRLSMIAGLGFIVILTGFILDKTGLKPLKIEVNASKTSLDLNPDEAAPPVADTANIFDSDKKPIIVVYPEKFNLQLPSDGYQDSLPVYFRLSGFPKDQEEVRVLFSHKKRFKRYIS